MSGTGTQTLTVRVVERDEMTAVLDVVRRLIAEGYESGYVGSGSSFAVSTQTTWRAQTHGRHEAEQAVSPCPPRGGESE